MLAGLKAVTGPLTMRACIVWPWLQLLLYLGKCQQLQMIWVPKGHGWILKNERSTQSQREGFSRPLVICVNDTSWLSEMSPQGSLFLSLWLWAPFVLGACVFPSAAEPLRYLGVSVSPHACASYFHRHPGILCWMMMWYQVTLCPERCEKTGFNIWCHFFILPSLSPGN